MITWLPFYIADDDDERTEEDADDSTDADDANQEETTESDDYDGQVLFFSSQKEPQHFDMNNDSFLEAKRGECEVSAFAEH